MKIINYKEEGNYISSEILRFIDKAINLFDIVEIRYFNNESLLPLKGDIKTIYCINNSYLKGWNGSSYYNTDNNKKCISTSYGDFYAKKADFNSNNYNNLICNIFILKDETFSNSFTKYFYNGTYLDLVSNINTIPLNWFTFIWKWFSGFTLSELRNISDTQLETVTTFQCIESNKVGKWKYDSYDTTSIDDNNLVIVTNTGKRLKKLLLVKNDVGLNNVPNLDTTNAVNNQHTHSNKSILDSITEAFTTTLKNIYDNKFNTPSGNASQYVAGDGSIKNFPTDLNNLGIVNASTGVSTIASGNVTLTATPPNGWVTGQTVTVTTSGNIPFVGINFTTGTTFNLGDKLQVVGNQFARLIAGDVNLPNRQEVGLISNNGNVNQAFKELLVDWTTYDNTLGTKDTASSVILWGWGLPSNILNIQIRVFFGGTQQSVSFSFSQLSNGLYYGIQRGIKVYILLRDVTLIPSTMTYNLNITLTNNVVERLGANPAVISLLRSDTLNTNVNASISTINSNISTINSNITTINNTLATIANRDEVGLVSNNTNVNKAFKEFWIDWSGYNNAYGARDVNSTIILHGWGITTGIQLQLRVFFNGVQQSPVFLFSQIANGLYYSATNGIKIYLSVRDITLVPLSMTYNLNVSMAKSVVEILGANPAIFSLLRSDLLDASITNISKGQYTTNSNRAIERYFDELYLVKGNGWDDSRIFQLTYIFFNNKYNIKVALYDPANPNANTAILQYDSVVKPKGLVELVTLNDSIFLNSKILLNNLDPFIVSNNRAVNITFTDKAFNIDNNPSIKQLVSSSGVSINDLVLSDNGNVNKAFSELYIDWSGYDNSQGILDKNAILSLTGWGLSYRLGLELKTKTTSNTLLYLFTYLYADPNIPNLYYRNIYGIKIYAVLNDTTVIPSTMTYNLNITLNKSLVYVVNSNPYTYLTTKKYVGDNFEELKKTSNLKYLDTYVSNPNNGLLGYNYNLLTNADFNTVQTSGNRYIWLSELIDNTCISSTGVINNVNLQNKISTFFDYNFSYTANMRYTLRLLSCWNASANGTNTAILVDTPDTQDGKAWTWMPLNMYNYLKTKTNALITTTNTYTYPTTQNIVILDFRSAEVKTIIEAILSNIQTYFNTNVSTLPTISSSNNYNTLPKKGDFFTHIQIRAIGAWGEGDLVEYNAYSNITDLVKVVELYKKYFYDKILIAPTFGSRDENCPTQLRDFQNYLLTTTYGGTVVDGNGLLYGNKEFGIFIDHQTNNDTSKDFTLTYNPYLLPIAKNKYKKAPVTGENGSNLDVGSSVGCAKYASMFRYANSIAWGNEWKWSPSGIEYYKQVVNFIGYRIGIVYNNLDIVGSTLTGSISMQNFGLAQCYDDFWEIQLVTRDKDTNNIIDVFSLSDSINTVSSYFTDNFGSIYEDNLAVINISKTLTNTSVNAFIRIVDKKHINENMYLINSNRNTQGEYCVYSNTYPVIYNLNGGINHPNNRDIRYLYEDFVPKPAKKNNAIFDGWYLEPSFTNKVEKISVNYLSTVTLYAKFINTITL